MTARTVETPNGTVDVVFDINEGEKTGIKEIRFVGNHVYSTGKLVGMMETTEMNYLSFLKTSDVYDPDRIAKDAELIRRYYLKNGYADFRVIGSDAVYDASPGGYVLTISVEEGPQYHSRFGARRIAAARRSQRAAAATGRRPCPATPITATWSKRPSSA